MKTKAQALAPDMFEQICIPPSLSQIEDLLRNELSVLRYTG